MASCGGSGDASQANGARGAASISLAAKLTMGGTVELAANWIDSISSAASAATCADATRGFVQDGPRYALPRTPSTATFGGHTVTVVASIAGFHGPGAYDAPAVVGADGTPTVLLIDGLGWGAAGGGTAHVDVHPDDSGLLVFQKLTPSAANPAPAASGTKAAAPPAPQRQGTLSGTLSWTCANQGVAGAGGAATTGQSTATSTR